MGRANKDVGGYRGRRTLTDILKFIAIALGVVVVLVLAGLFFAQRYIVYTDEGPKLELPPFLQMFRGGEKDPVGSASLPDPSDVSVVIDPGGSASEPPAEPEKPSLAIQLPVEDVLNGTAAAKLEEAGASALILEAKAPSGQLIWHSDLFAADWAEVNAPQSNNEALKQWNEGKVYTVARVCCFRDDSVPYSLNKRALRKGNYNWRDELGLRWMSPAHEENQAYIAGLCGELAALGFDEIVLEQWHFPVGGKTENITRGDRYDPNAFTTELEDMLTQVQGALGPYDTKLSLRFGAEALNDGCSLSGLSPELLDRFASRFWTEQEGRMSLSASPAVRDLQERTVEIVPQADEDREFFQAVIPPQE